MSAPTAESATTREANGSVYQTAGAALLGRHTSSAPLLREMDGLRVLPLLLVIGLHYMHRLCIIAPGGLLPNPDNTLLMAVMQKGDFGVQIFFTISGFVLGLPFARQFLLAGRPVEPGRFYLRRIVRIQGPLLINLVIHVAVLGLVLHKYPLSELMAQFLPTWGCWYQTSTGQLSLINPVAWSLEPEMQFCLLMPLICRVFDIGSLALRRGVLALAVLLPPFWKAGLNPALLPAQIEYFVMGLLLADCHLTSWSRPEPVNGGAWTWRGLAGFAGMSGLLALRHDHQLFTDLAMPWVLFLGMGGVLNSPLWKGIFAHPVLATVGGWCYTIYLYHILIIYGTLTLLFKVVPLAGLHPAFWTYLPVCLASVVIACAILYVLTERPFIELASKLAKRGKGRSPAS